MRTRNGKQEMFSESFHTSFNNLLRVRSPSPRHADNRSHTAAHGRHAAAPAGSQRNQTSRSDKPKNAESRNAQTKAAIKSYKCEAFRHFTRVCPTRLNREANCTNSPGNRNPNERSKRSRSSGEKSTLRTGSAKRKPRVRETREV